MATWNDAAVTWNSATTTWNDTGGGGGGAQTVSPVGIASAEAFGTARLDLDIQPSGIASAQAFGTPSITTGPVTIQPTGISSQEIVPSPSVTRTDALLEIMVTPIYTGETFGTPTVIAHQVIQARSIESREAFGATQVRQQVFLATSPQVLEPPAAIEYPHRRVDVPRGITYYRIGPTWYSGRDLPDDQEVDELYRGGYEYAVDKATADALLL